MADQDVKAGNEFFVESVLFVQIFVTEFVCSQLFNIMGQLHV